MQQKQENYMQNAIITHKRYRTNFITKRKFYHNAKDSNFINKYTKHKFYQNAKYTNFVTMHKTQILSQCKICRFYNNTQNKSLSQCKRYKFYNSARMVRTTHRPWCLLFHDLYNSIVNISVKINSTEGPLSLGWPLRRDNQCDCDMSADLIIPI